MKALPVLVGTALLILCTSVSSQPPAPGNAKGSKEPQSQTQRGQEPAANNERGTERSPIFVKSLPSKEAEEKAHADEQREENKATTDRLLAYSTVALVIVTFALALFTGSLWKATVDLGKEARATADQQSIDTQKALEISRESTNAVVVSAMPILAPFIADKAARLYPAELIASPYVPRLQFVLQNFGATPGIVRQVRAEMRYVEQERLPEINFETLSRLGVELIVPGKLYGEHARFAGSIMEVPAFRAISIAEHQLLLNEATTGTFSRIYLFGKTVYDDFFGTRHTSTFCLKVRRGGYHGPHGGAKYNRITRNPIPENSDI